MRIIKLNIIFFLLANAALNGFSQDIVFNHITDKDGLYYNWIWDIFKDSEGYMWFSSQEGAFRYDGYEFDTYTFKSTSGFTNVNINAVHEDPDSNIWFATSEGMIKYTRETNSYKRYFLDSLGGPNSNLVNAMVAGPDDKLWIATANGLFSFNRHTESFKVYSSSNGVHSIQSNIINALLLDSKSNLWLGDVNGVLYLYVPHNDHFIVYNNEDKPGNSPVSVIYEDHQGYIWVGYHGSGASKFNTWSKEYVRNYQYRENENGIANNIVRGIVENKDHTIWFGTEKGLSILDQEEESFTTINSNFDKANGLNDNAIYSLFKEENGDIWVGTFFGGVNVFYNRPQFIKAYLPDGSPDNISGKAIGPIIKDEENLWIGTEDKGLNLFDPVSENFRQFTQQNTNLSYDNIHALCKDDAGNLWIGTYTGGLNLLPAGSSEFKQFTNSGGVHALSNNSVYSLCYDSENHLWIGTRGGLNRYDYVNRRFDHMFIDIIGNSFIWDIEEDSAGNIWLCTYGNGLYMLDKAKDYSPRHIPLPINHTTSLLIRGNKEILLGSEKQGLIIYNPETEEVQHLTTETGLIDNTINGIIEDRSGTLWFTTNNGICKTRDFNEIEVITVNDGLVTNRFNYNSVAMADGLLYFGSTRGLIVINPELQVVEETLPTIHLCAIHFPNGKFVDPEFSGTINYKEELELKHDFSSFSIKYTGINLRESSKTRYAIRLLGMDKEWSYMGNSRMVNYSNLEPGDYTFSVRTVDKTGALQDNEKSLRISIIPPWWDTALAKIIFILLGMTFISFIGYLIIMRLRTQHALEIEKIEKRKIKDVNEAKINFFTNISHEFKTPLTLIKGPINKLITSNGISSSQRNWYYNLIKKNTERLLHLINELLEFRNITQDHLELKLEQINISDIIEDIAENFYWIAESNQINFTVQNDESITPLCADSIKMEKILNNLLLNAISNTPKDGFISIETYTKKNYLYIHVRNSGKGLSRDNISKLFDRNFTESSNTDINRGSGIGLAYTKTLVELHKGDINVYSLENVETSFIIKIPLNLDEIYSIETKALEHKYEAFTEEEQTSDKLLDLLGGKGQAKVLVVEDVKELRDFISDALRENFTVITASNGTEAFKLAQAENPDVIVSDVMMPKMNGFDLCSKIKNSFTTSHIRIILLTVLTDDSDKLNGYKSGADAYISKPFDIELLIYRIQNLLRDSYHLKQKFTQDLELTPKEITYSNPDEELLKVIIDTVNKNIDDPKFDVNKFAKEIGLSKSTLYRKMKSITGLPINEFVQILRLKRAAALIRESKMSISEIAYATGFNDPYYFSRSFKKNFKVSPKEYRESTSASPGKVTIDK